MSVSVSVLKAGRAVESVEVVRMLTVASRDEGLCAATYLPRDMGADDVVVWARSRPGFAWVVFDNGVPCGWLEFSPVKDGCGFVFPSSAVEREVWLLPHARGRRVVQQAMALIYPELFEAGVSHVVGVAWLANHSAVKGMLNAGFVTVGEGWWGSPSSGGMCAVAVLSLGDPALGC